MIKLSYSSKRVFGSWLKPHTCLCEILLKERRILERSAATLRVGISRAREGGNWLAPKRNNKQEFSSHWLLDMRTLKHEILTLQEAKLKLQT